MSEELDSQLSAMFDDELPTAECELLARRLSRDELLKARWGRYAVIGAAIRAERGVRLNAPLAGRVNAVLRAEPDLASPATAQHPQRGSLRWWQPVAGAAVAAGVAAVSVLWLRAQAPLVPSPLSAQAQPPAAALSTVANVGAANTVPGADTSYVVPPTPAVRPKVVPSIELANYVVAHSVFSSPVARSTLLSSFMTSEPVPSEDVREDVKSNAQ
ncbi:MAG TPA: sigma-E factor negative regulatory protein [Steroidobacteraceae bacterium]|jgi:negative regulator of sigma E activity|nr:sigma-E factor negative regulatory protein [Steroidobacteraceae bacterium]